MRHVLLILVVSGVLFMAGCQEENTSAKIRPMADTVGFAQHGWQVDSVMNRIKNMYGNRISDIFLNRDIGDQTTWKAVICPHDDFSYAGYLYPAALSHIKTPTVILFGVAHKARTLGLENRLIFDSFSAWHGPYGNIFVSSFRDSIIRALPTETYIVHDEMQRLEHSVEAMLPFLQYYNRNVEIISILVPAMPFDRMQEISGLLSDAIAGAAEKRGWHWGEDYAFIISSDAVHYGDEDWGGKNYAPYGADSAGYDKAVSHEMEIVNTCLTGDMNEEKVRQLTTYLVQDENFREYKWSWCGRYSIPLGLLTTIQMGKRNGEISEGVFLGFGSSIDHLPIPVQDLKMGVTAPANIRHWVGYAAIGYQ